MPLMRSWVESANTPETDFPLNNLPCGVFSTPATGLRCGVAIGDQILDVTALEAAGLLKLAESPIFDAPFWNPLMELGPAAWARFRILLLGFLTEGAPVQAQVSEMLVPQSAARMHLPFIVGELTDFYSGRYHAENVSRMFKGKTPMLTPNWAQMPLAYNGRASSVIVSGTGIRRPVGQIKPSGQDRSILSPTRRFDFELELGAVIGQPAEGPISVAQADEMIFGYVLLNDWSARDFQAWEANPMGPFTAKASATTISPWIVMKAALENFRRPAPERHQPLLAYLREPGPIFYDIDLEVALQAEGYPEKVVSRTNSRHLYYASAQQLAHQAISGAPTSVGDLIGSGTISGPDAGSYGSMLELSQGGKEPFEIAPGVTRGFLEDGDSVILRGHARGEGFRIGFGECRGKMLPSAPLPDWARDA
ncbi:fumarylacetoacetase [Falsigemmobacter intermedius]|uniref:fumarylacetoacetase n=1 Tax=Falsigemmobacter intermedius TaxID=1553448 RepID=A0A3S3WQC9_9RHOB|nr:fumarylacetoacetase [Falsigemmobacter intermedius]RWY42275.1 fumarylacetoacetase [Falsigemmobacter intermedius]